MAELLKKDKVSFTLSNKQMIDFKSALKYNSERIALTNEQIYRNKLIESYFECACGDKMTVSVADMIRFIRILLENYSYMSEKIKVGDVENG